MLTDRIVPWGKTSLMLQCQDIGLCVHAWVYACKHTFFVTHWFIATMPDRKAQKFSSALNFGGKWTTKLESHTPSVPLVRERPLAPHDCTIEGQHHRSLGQNRRKSGFAGCMVCCSPCSVTVPSLHLGPEPSWLREGRFGDLAQLRRWPAKPATSPCTSASSSLKWELWPL